MQPKEWGTELYRDTLSLGSLWTHPSPHSCVNDSDSGRVVLISKRLISVLVIKVLPMLRSCPCTQGQRANDEVGWAAADAVLGWADSLCSLQPLPHQSWVWMKGKGLWTSTLNEHSSNSKSGHKKPQTGHFNYALSCLARTGMNKLRQQFENGKDNSVAQIFLIVSNVSSWLSAKILNVFIFLSQGGLGERHLFMEVSLFSMHAAYTPQPFFPPQRLYCSCSRYCVFFFTDFVYIIF